MVNYQLGKIYKITSDQTDKIYIGSTCNKYLSSRLAEHRKQKKHGMYGTKSSIILDNLDAQITLIESYPCNSKDELLKKEREHITLHKNICVNKYIPGRTQKEYRQDNRASIMQKKKIYRANNRDEINAKRCIKINCTCGAFISKRNIARHMKSPTHLAENK